MAALFNIYTLKNLLAYLREDFSAALHYADAQLPYESTKMGMAQASIFDSLTRLAAYAQSDGNKQKQLMRRVNHSQQLLWKRAQLMPGNFQHKYDLVAAEKCRVLADYTTAMELYDRSIAGAQANGYQQEEALANELAAKFYLAWQKEKIATTYMQEAYYCYQRWGATAKTNYLEQRYAQLLSPILQAPSLLFNPLSTLSTITHSITNEIVDSKESPGGDLGAAIQAAQLLSSIIEFPTLINQLCRILLQSSGAQICIPILLSNNKSSNQDGWQVYQIEPLGTKDIANDLIGIPLEKYHDLPLRLINQVRHSRQTIILSGRNVDSLLLADEYFQRYQPQSMMCLPLLYRGELQGIVYLENRHTADIFTSDRQIIVEFLAAQAVITLHNAQLYESVAQRSAAMEASLDGMAIIEKDGRLIYINLSYAQMYGYRVDELIGQHWSCLHDPDSMKKFEEGACTIVAKSGKWRGESIAIRKDGSTFYREVTLSLLANGQLISICRDITEQQSAESERQRIAAQLAASQQQCYNLIQSINGVVWEYDLKTEQFVFVSDRAESLFGYPLTDWLAKTNFWQNIVYPEDLDLVVNLYNQAITNRCNCEFEYRLVAADGRVIWVYDVSTLVFDDDGQPMSSNGLLINISDIKRVEAALHDANEKLEITNAELQRATRLKDEFLATMSHELRTPMNAILGMSEMLQEEILGPLNSRQLNSISTIEQSGEHLLSLINDILDVSKISAGKLELNIDKTSLTQLCEASLMFVKQKAFEKQIKINTHLPTDLESIWVDDRRMRQVLINLLTNAVKFTPHGGHVTLTVSLQSPLVGKDGYGLCFAVTDTGIGIKRADIAKLFQPFIQIDSSLNRQYEGTGLGLMLVKQIVELHGGWVSIESEVGQGSCFILVIPQHHRAAEQELLSAVLPVMSVHEMLLDYKIPLILLAEDNQINIDTFASYLIGKGYQVIFAYNGQEAIEQAQEKRPDLILMDIQMPGIDGIEAIKQIRQQPALADTPIIALTALAMAGDREKCLAAGANSYLSKPIKLRELHHSIQQYLQVEKTINRE
jgi:PAS domain S-box-containing protein